MRRDLKRDVRTIEIEHVYIHVCTLSLRYGIHTTSKHFLFFLFSYRAWEEKKRTVMIDLQGFGGIEIATLVSRDWVFPWDVYDDNFFG